MRIFLAFLVAAVSLCFWDGKSFAAPDVVREKPAIIVGVGFSRTISLSTGKPIREARDDKNEPIFTVMQTNEGQQVFIHSRKGDKADVGRSVVNVDKAIVRGVSMGEMTFTLIDESGRREAFHVIVGAHLNIAVESTHRVRLTGNKPISKSQNASPKVLRVDALQDDPTTVMVTGLSEDNGWFTVVGQNGVKEYFVAQVYSFKGSTQHVLFPGQVQIFQMSNKNDITSVFIQHEEVVSVTPDLATASRIVIRGVGPGVSDVRLQDDRMHEENYRFIVLSGEELFVPLEGTCKLRLSTKVAVRSTRSEDDKVATAAIDPDDRKSVTLSGKATGEARVFITGEEGNPELYRVLVRSEKEPGANTIFVKVGKQTIDLPGKTKLRSVYNSSDKVIRVESVIESGSMTIFDGEKWFKVEVKPPPDAKFRRALTIVSKKPGIARLSVTDEKNKSEEFLIIVRDEPERKK